jgi:hypothetical protein
MLRFAESVFFSEMVIHKIDTCFHAGEQGLPDGIFSNQKSQFEKNFHGPWK